MKSKILTFIFLLFCSAAIAQPAGIGGGSTPWPPGGSGSSNWTDSGSDVYITGGNVGIGGTSPSQLLSLYDGNIVMDQVDYPDAPTVAVGAAGSLNATYSYCVTYYNANGETRCSSKSSNVTPSNQQVTVTIPTSSESITGRKIYRTLANANSESTGHIIAYLITTIADNTTTTYSDNALDATIVANVRAPFATTYGGKLYHETNEGEIIMGQISDEETILGYTAGYQFTQDNYRGWQNTFIGGKAGYYNRDGFRNTFVGYRSGENNVNGDFNAGFGPWTLEAKVGGDNNSAFNHGSLENGHFLEENTAYGFYSLYSLGLKESGSGDTGRSAFGQAIASFSDYSGTVAGTVKATTTNSHPYITGDNVRIFGTENYDGIYSVTSIDSNNFYFTDTYVSNETTGDSDFAGASQAWSSGNGINSLDNAGNICIGFYCAQDMGRGQFNTFIGYKAHYENGTINDILKYSGCWGAECQVNKDNSLVIGSDKTSGATAYGYVNVGINERRPIYELTFNGTEQDITIGVNRNKDNDTAGKNLTIKAGSAPANGSIAALNKTPTAGGTGYEVGDILTLTGGDGNATAKVIETFQGIVRRVALVNEGSGYTAGTGQATSGGGSGCTLNITTVRTTTDENGGNLILESGTATGTGTSQIDMYVHPNGSTGSTDTTRALALTILEDGKVGINDAAPESMLFIKQTTDAKAGGILLEELSGAGQTRLYHETSPGTYSVLGVSSLETNNLIVKSGAVGMGTNDPTGVLQVDEATYGQVTIGGTGMGCLMLFDTDLGGWTECTALNGTLSCTTDADGVCDGS